MLALSKTRLDIIRVSAAELDQTLGPGVRRTLYYVRFGLLLPIFQSPNALVKYQSQNPLHTQPPASAQTTQLLFPSQIHLFRASFKNHLHGQGPAPGNTCLTTLRAYSSFVIAPICECVNLPWYSSSTAAYKLSSARTLDVRAIRLLTPPVTTVITLTPNGAISTRSVFAYACRAAFEALYTLPKTYGITPAKLPSITIVPFASMSNGAKTWHRRMTPKTLVSKTSRTPGRSMSRAGTV